MQNCASYLQPRCCNKLMSFHRCMMPSWMILCTQQRLSAKGYDTRWTDPERSRFASVHYLLISIRIAMFVSGSNSCMRLDRLSAARHAVITCVASRMHLSWKCCRALGFGMDGCQERSLYNIAIAYVAMGFEGQHMNL